jgi:hypothetical protein
MAGYKVSDGTYRQIFSLYFEVVKISSLLNELGEDKE